MKLKIQTSQGSFNVHAITIEDIINAACQNFDFAKSEVCVTTTSEFLKTGLVKDYFQDGDTVIVADLGKQV